MNWFSQDSTIKDLIALMVNTQETLAHLTSSFHYPREMAVQLMDRQFDLIFSVQEHLLDELGIMYPVFPDDYVNGEQVDTHKADQPKKESDNNV